MLLSEVALGDPYDMYKAQYFDKPPPGYQSVRGVGKWVPDPSKDQKLYVLTSYLYWSLTVNLGPMAWSCPRENPQIIPTLLQQY